MAKNKALCCKIKQRAVSNKNKQISKNYKKCREEIDLKRNLL